MKSTLVALSLVLALAGCATTAPVAIERPVVQKVEYIIKVPPAELLRVPPQVERIDVEKAKQSDVARWILLNEERTKKLENMLIEIAKFFSAEEASLNGDLKK